MPPLSPKRLRLAHPCQGAEPRVSVGAEHIPDTTTSKDHQPQELTTSERLYTVSTWLSAAGKALESRLEPTASAGTITLRMDPAEFAQLLGGIARASVLLLELSLAERVRQ